MAGAKVVASSRLQQTRAAKDAKLLQARAAKAAKAAKAKAPKEERAGGGSEAPPPPPLALHIAAHVRRGDLAGGDPKRLVSNEEVGAALAELAKVVTELRGGDATHGGLTLAATVHVMSEGKPTDF